jgi:type IV pilus assembly protein PilQ
VIGDERTNTIIVTDIPNRVEAVDELIATLDTQAPQVMIEARIVETSKTYSRDLGVVWGTQIRADASTGTSTGIAGLHNASARYALNLPGDGGASTLGFSFGNIVDSFTLDLALNALETEGRGRIISAPKIATQNNERAEIEQGTRIPITNTTATEIQVEFVSASLLLQVTPQITAEGTVVLDVMVENNSPDFVNTAGGIPSIRTQRAQTKVLVSDGGTTVIGGIFVVNEGDSEVGVPWFRKVPVFGWLFRTQSIQKENRELLIFLTPKIMKLG